MIEIRSASGDDWVAYRQVRLRALTDAPDAFASTLEREAAFDDDVWIARLTSAHTLIAWAGDDPVGTVTGLPDGEMVAMWVAPDQRGKGVGAQLVAALVDWSRAAGLTELRTWVADGNDTAQRLYERMGFVPTGEVALMRDGIGERRLLRAL